MTQTAATPSLIQELWASYRRQPGWVQLWVALILVPVNAASLLFIDQPMGWLIALLANIGMLLNLPVMVITRGFTNAMAVPHLVPWTALVVLLIVASPPATGLYAWYLWVLLVVDAISLAFDYPDSLAWWRQRRAA